MANFNIRLEDSLKEKSFSALHKIGISPSDAVRQFLQYVAETGKLPVKNVLVSEEDAALLQLVKQRLNEPHLFQEITLDDLPIKSAR